MRVGDIQEENEKKHASLSKIAEYVIRPAYRIVTHLLLLKYSAHFQLVFLNYASTVQEKEKGEDLQRQDSTWQIIHSIHFFIIIQLSII